MISLGKIEDQSIVLLDASILIHGLTGRVGSALASSPQAFNLLSKCKVGRLSGVITHQAVSVFAKALTAIALVNDGVTPKHAVEKTFHQGFISRTPFFDPFPRLQALLESPLRLVAPQNADLLRALALVERHKVKLDVALSLVAYERCYGPRCIVATANGNYDSFPATEYQVFKPTDVNFPEGG